MLENLNPSILFIYAESPEKLPEKPLKVCLHL